MIFIIEFSHGTRLTKTLTVYNYKFTSESMAVQKPLQIYLTLNLCTV